MDRIILGSHVGMSGKDMFLASVKEAESYGANALMIYTGASQNTKRKEFSLGVEFLSNELKRTAAFSSRTLVLHPGSHLGEGVEAGIDQLAKGLDLVLERDETDVFIALETMAGKGSEIGKTFEELNMIYERVKNRGRLRVCFDTCHVNDAGYDLSMNYENILAKFDRLIGLEPIAVIHVNDSSNPCGSHKDRHANIGAGAIGLETLRRIVHDERFSQIPKILETPFLCADGETKKTLPPYRQEIEQLL